MINSIFRVDTYHVEISNLFKVPIHNGISKLEHDFVSVFLIGFLLLVRDGLSDDLLLIQVLANGLKVAFLKALDDVPFSKDGFEISKKVLDENLCCFGVSEMHTVGVHGSKESCAAKAGTNAQHERVFSSWRSNAQ